MVDLFYWARWAEAAEEVDEVGKVVKALVPAQAPTFQSLMGLNVPVIIEVRSPTFMQSVAAHTPNTVNGGVTLFSVRIAGKSVLELMETEDPAAKALFALSICFAVTAVGFSAPAALKQNCVISKEGTMSSGCAHIFYNLAKDANKKAELRAKKANFIRRPLVFRNPHGVAFMPPCPGNVNILKTTINGLVVFITIYGYVKISVKISKKVIVILRSVHKKIERSVHKKIGSMKRNKNSRLIKKSATLAIYLMSIELKKSKCKHQNKLTKSNLFYSKERTLISQT